MAADDKGKSNPTLITEVCTAASMKWGNRQMLSTRYTLFLRICSRSAWRQNR